MATRIHEELNVLVVDDDDALRSLLVDVITREEHQAVPAESAERGLELLPYWTFHVAFIDQNLPGMDGIILGEYLRRNNSDMVIVMITGDDTEKIRRRSRDLSLQFLAKPFQVEEIRDVLDVAIRSYRNTASSVSCGADYAPAIAAHYQDLPAQFSMPHASSRIEDRLISVIRRSLNDMATARYTERDRVVALSGLLAAQVLGIQLPRAGSGATLFEQYDLIMKDRGTAPAFEGETDGIGSVAPRDPCR